MSREEIVIDSKKLDRMMIAILRLEQKNNKTKTKTFAEMVQEIKKIIIEEVKEGN